MLTAEHEKTLEIQQSRALKVIFGFEKSYSDLLEQSKLQPLKERRISLTDKFAIKMMNNPRFTYLFPRRRECQRRARNGNVFEESNARTNRLYNSPIYYMRRRLNHLNNNDKKNGATPTALNPTNDIRCDFIFDEWR